MTFLARGDVALSVAITSVTTLLAPLVTPALIYLLASQWLEVSAAAMFWSIVQVVVLPIALGVLAQSLLRDKVKAAALGAAAARWPRLRSSWRQWCGQPGARIATSGLMIFAVVVLHNGLGLLLGYWLNKLTGMDISKRKALSIEVGMQNFGPGRGAYHGPFFALPGSGAKRDFQRVRQHSGPLVTTLFQRFRNEESATASGKSARFLRLASMDLIAAGALPISARGTFYVQFPIITRSA